MVTPMCRNKRKRSPAFLMSALYWCLVLKRVFFLWGVVGVVEIYAFSIAFGRLWSQVKSLLSYQHTKNPRPSPI